MGQMNFFYGNQTGAPSLGALGVGDLATVLDAALVNGFATQSTTIVVASNVATATVTGHNWRVGQRVTIAGVTGGPTGFASINGTFRITAVATNTYTFTTVGVSNGSATGTITSRLTGLGWGIAFTATNQRAYRAATGLRHYLMVNDNSNTNTSIVRGFTAMTAVTTGTGPFPTVAQSHTNLKWIRPDPTTFSSTSAPNDSWVVVGDDKRFFIGVCQQVSGYRFWSGFGEFQSYRSADAFNTFIMGAGNAAGDDSINPQAAPYPQYVSPNSQGALAYYTTMLCFARAANQTTVSYTGGYFSGFVNNTMSFGNNAGAVIAGTSSPITNGIELSFLDVVETTAAGSNIYNRRGRLPILCPWQYPDFPNNDGVIYTGLVNFPDILVIRGWLTDANSGLIFPVGDWDTVLS